MFFKPSKNFRWLFISAIIATIIVVIIMDTVNTTSNNNIDSPKEQIVRWLDKITLLALAITLVAGIIAHYLKSNIDKENKKTNCISG